jgi:hypothetical protein
MARRRDHRLEADRRDQLARGRGFRNRQEQRRFSRHVGNRRDLDRLPREAQVQRARSLQVLSLKRANDQLSLADAAHQAGTTVDSVRWYAGYGLYSEAGHWQVRQGDRLYRRMHVYSNGRKLTIGVRGSHKASELSDYHHAVGIFLDTGEESLLRRFVGKSVAGVPYETDPDVLEEMARRGTLDMESIYELVA